MPATKITDLLPIPPGTRKPHAYQVLGLEDGEQDSAVIAAAVQSVVSHLKAAKPETEPTLWQQAARLVKGAQEILADPDKKAQLDARFGIVSLDDSAEAGQPSSPDALAAFLPSADPLMPAPDPLAAVLPQATPLSPNSPAGSGDNSGDRSQLRPPAPVPVEPAVMPDAAPVNAMPPGLFGTPATSDEGPSDSPSPTVGVVVNAPRRKRKQSKTGTFLFLTFAFGTFGIIGALVYFLIFGPGQVAITQSDGKISISTQPPADGATTMVGQPRPVTPAKKSPPRDPIMGNLATSDSSPGPFMQPSGSTGLMTGGLSTDPAGDPTGDPIGDPAGDPTMDRSTDPIGDPGGNLDPGATAPTGVPEMEMESSLGTQPTKLSDVEPEMETLTDAMIDDADRTLARVRMLIRSAKWDEMKSAAESALEQPMSAEQRDQAQALFELADLATYYRVGLEKAVSELKTGNDFEVTEDVRVIVVETGPDLLTVRLNAKNRSYSFDLLPWSLAHRLATFTMPSDDPTVLAAKAVYQAISPNANEEYRDQALQWLNEISDEVEGADPQRLEKTIRSLLAES